MKNMVYVPPTEFCVCPSMGYWEIDGKSVSSTEADCGLNPQAVWKESEVARNLHKHTGYFVEKFCDEVDFVC